MASNTLHSPNQEQHGSSWLHSSFGLLSSFPLGWQGSHSGVRRGQSGACQESSAASVTCCDSDTWAEDDEFGGVRKSSLLTWHNGVVVFFFFSLGKGGITQGHRN